MTAERLRRIEESVGGFRKGDDYALHDLLYKEPRASYSRIKEYLVWARKKRGPYTRVQSMYRAKAAREKRRREGRPYDPRNKFTDDQVSAYYDAEKEKYIAKQASCYPKIKDGTLVVKVPRRVLKICKAARLHKKDEQDRPLKKPDKDIRGWFDSESLYNQACAADKTAFPECYD